MKNLFKVLLLSTALMFSGPIVNMAKANHAAVPAACAISQDQFMVSVKNLEAKMYKASDKARTIIMGKINEARLSANLWELDVDDLMVGVFMDKGQPMVGLVMFKDHCVVPGSVKVFPATLWVEFLNSLELTIDDFTLTAGV